MTKLTRREQRLLKYPPTPETWLCPGKLSNGDPCGAIVPGSHKQCWLCAKRKPRRPKLLWPAYRKTARKAGIAPG